MWHMVVTSLIIFQNTIMPIKTCQTIVRRFWLFFSGLDGVVCDYHSNFLQNAFNGRRLGMIDHNDLTNLGVKKVGHQEILLDAVELLKSLVTYFVVQTYCYSEAIK